MGDGIIYYRSANNVIITEGIGGVVGVEYFRFARRLRRDPHRKRTILWHRDGWVSDESEDYDDRRMPQTMFNQTKPDAVVANGTNAPSAGDNDMCDVQSGVSSEHAMYTPESKAPPTPTLGEIAGANPFSSAGSESACSSALGHVEAELRSSEEAESRARMADGESYCPPNPPKAPMREVKTKSEEAEPTFATQTTVQSSRQRRQETGGGWVGVPASPRYIRNARRRSQSMK